MSKAKQDISYPDSAFVKKRKAPQFFYQSVACQLRPFPNLILFINPIVIYTAFHFWTLENVHKNIPIAARQNLKIIEEQLKIFLGQGEIS